MCNIIRLSPVLLPYPLCFHNTFHDVQFVDAILARPTMYPGDVYCYGIVTVAATREPYFKQRCNAMWIRPLTLAAHGTEISLKGAPVVPLPPWSGVPVAMDIEVSADVLAAALKIDDVARL